MTERPTNTRLPVGCAFPGQGVGDFHGDEEPVTQCVPEAEAAGRSAAYMIGERVVLGRMKYGTKNVNANPLHLIRMAKEEVADCWAYLGWAEERLAPCAGRLRIYIAGPYRADTVVQRDRNIHAARLAAGELLRRGHSPLCPHTMTAEFEDHFPDLPDACFLVTDVDWLTVAHAVLILPGWTGSEGTLEEKTRAEALGLPIYYSLDDIPPPEEVRRSWPPPTTTS